MTTAPEGDDRRSPTERGLLDAILAAPEDDAPRLIYADWLADQGDPLRAEFIRTQCRLARLPPSDPEHLPLSEREEELRESLVLSDTLRRSFDFPPECRAGYLASDSEGTDFARGFPYFVDVRGLAPPNVSLLVERTTVRGLSLIDLRLEQLRAVIEQAAFASFTGLHLSGVYQPSAETDACLAMIADSPNTARLSWIEISLNPSSAGLDHLTRWEHLTGLKRLVLRFGAEPTDPTAIVRLARSGVMRRLEHLELYSGCSGENTATFLAEAEAPLHTLDVWHAWDGAVLKSLAARSAHFPSLTRLDLGRHRFGPALVDALAAARFPRLVDLCLCQCGLGSKGATALARSGVLAGVRSLDLAENRIGDNGAVALARSPDVRSLRRLAFAQNVMKRKGLLAIAQSEALRGLTTLDLGQFGKAKSSAGDFATFLRELAMPDLRHLILDYCPIGDQGATALAANPNLQGLRWLSLRSGGIGPGGMKALLSSPYLRHVEILDLYSNAGGEEAAALLDPAVMPRLMRCDLDYNGISEGLVKRLDSARGRVLFCGPQTE
jgi:uncharacterized protein (TIGR02996 family)